MTIRDIAEKLNVGKTTVSLALSDKYGINEDTKARIVLTAHEMGYDFSKAKKRIKPNAKSIKIIVSSKSFISTEFWTDIIRGIEKESSTLGYKIEIFAFDTKTPISDLYLEILKGTSVGLIFIDNFFDGDFTVFTDADIPMVLVDPRRYLGNNLTQVKANNYLGGYVACKYLIDAGHRRIGFLGSTEYSLSLRIRYLGCLDCFNSHVAPSEGKLFSMLSSDPNPAYMHNEEELLRVFTNPSDRPTAIFCANDAVALSVVNSLKTKLNLTVPDDVSLIGFDNVKRHDSMYTELTTVSIDQEEMGRTAVRLLLEEATERRKVKKSVEICGTLVEKSSVKRI